LKTKVFNIIKNVVLKQQLGDEGSAPSINKACGAINNSWSDEAGTARLRRVSCQAMIYDV
jgi:hypothetical protein